MRIDAHHSFSERHPLAYLGQILNRNRFEGSILVHPELVPTPEFVQAVVVQVDNIEPRLLDLWRADPKFRGVCMTIRSGIPDGLDELEKRNLTLDVISALPLIPEMAQRLPGLRIAIAHLGGPVDSGDEWAGRLEAAAQFPNVFCKLSGFLSSEGWLPKPDPWPPTPGCPPPITRPHVQHAMAVFGPRRLMFGSNWPASLPEHTWKENLALFTQSIGAQSMEVREELLGGSAARFYRV